MWFDGAVLRIGMVRNVGSEAKSLTFLISRARFQNQWLKWKSRFNLQTSFLSSIVATNSGKLFGAIQNGF